MRNIVSSVRHYIVVIYGCCLWLGWMVLEVLYERYWKPKPKPINYSNFKRPIDSGRISGKLDE